MKFRGWFSRWNGALSCDKFYFSSTWRLSCFCPFYLAYPGGSVIPLGWEICGDFGMKNGTQFHMTILNFDFYWDLNNG